ncbi:MAG: hypothetical protein KGQ80_02865 [Bacteroidetes bacterium]|nr:hypothetical protein [Bacteroidota bacterium]
MNLNRLAQYYRDPSELANHPLAELEELLHEYPFFTAGQLLLLKQYRIQNSSRYKKQHRKMLALAPDPVRAFLFTEGDAWGIVDACEPADHPIVDPPKEPEERLFEAKEPVDAGVDHPMAGSIQNQEESVDFLHQPHDLHDWFRFYAHLAQPHAPKAAAQEAAAQEKDFWKYPADISDLSAQGLGSDYERELKLAASSDLLNAPSAPLLTQGIDAFRVKVGDEQADPLTADAMHTIRMLAQASIDDEQLPASETLAEVFARQQEWDHAIAVYEQLILMNPEKMPIFAARIAEFKKAKG